MIKLEDTMKEEKPVKKHEEVMKQKNEIEHNFTAQYDAMFRVQKDMEKKMGIMHDILIKKLQEKNGNNE